MAASATAMSVARNVTFQDRVRFCLATAAVAAMAEVNTTSNHAARVVYAKAVVGGTADFVSAAIAVMTNSTVAAEAALGTADFGIPDSDLQFVVNTIFNALAGVAT